MAEDFSTSPIDPSELARLQKQEQAAARKLDLWNELSELNMLQYANEAAFNPVTMSKQQRFKSLEERVSRKEIEKKEDEDFAIVEEIERLSEEYEKKNPELTSTGLQLLYSRIKESDSSEEILRKAMSSQSDYSLADESLEFLERATKGDVQAGKFAQAEISPLKQESFPRQASAPPQGYETCIEISQEILGIRPPSSTKCTISSATKR